MKTGIITVQDGQITVRQHSDTCSSTRHYHSATVEDLEDAARALARWLELPSRNLARECRRIHVSDQLSAFLQERVLKTAQLLNERKNHEIPP